MVSLLRGPTHDVQSVTVWTTLLRKTMLHGDPTLISQESRNAPCQRLRPMMYRGGRRGARRSLISNQPSNTYPNSGSSFESLHHGLNKHLTSFIVLTIWTETVLLYKLPYVRRRVYLRAKAPAYLPALGEGCL